MSTIAESRETTRGAGDGSPDVVSRPRRSVEPPRIGPLPAPSLVERLRRSWSLYALVPAVAREGESGRVWKRAAWAAVALHLVVFAAIIVVGRLAHARADDTSPQVIAWVPPKEVAEEKQDDPTTESSSSPADGPHSAGSASGGRGSNEAATPVTGGQPPPTAPTPPIPSPPTPPLQSPIAIPQTAVGPSVDVPPPTAVGIPTLPPGPVESPGNQGGVGVGTHDGSNWGTSATPGPGGPDTGPGGKGNHTGDSATAPNGPGPGLDLGGGKGPSLYTRDHGIKIIVKVRPTITQAMIEAGTFGTVRISVTIGSDGSILSAEPMDRLANGGTQAAMDALRRCRFEPAVQNGKYITSSTVVRFDITERGV